MPYEHTAQSSAPHRRALREQYIERGPRRDVNDTFAGLFFVLVLTLAILALAWMATNGA